MTASKKLMRRWPQWMLMTGGMLQSLTATMALASDCRGIPESGSVVNVCQADNVITIQTSNQQWSWNLEQTQERLRQELELFLASHAREDLAGPMDIAVWLSIPEANPEATRARLVVKGVRHTFMFGLGLEPDEWTLTSNNVSILPDEGYPASFGWKPESVLLEKSNKCTEAQMLKRVEQQMGVGSLEHFTGGWYQLKTTIFTEMSSAQRLQSQNETRDCIESWALNHMFEWIAWRDVVFAFSWVPNG